MDVDESSSSSDPRSASDSNLVSVQYDVDAVDGHVVVSIVPVSKSSVSMVSSRVGPECLMSAVSVIDHMLEWQKVKVAMQQKQQQQAQR